MAVEIAKDKIMISQIITSRQDVLTVEGDVIVNDIKPDVLKIINTNGTICVYKREVIDGRVKIDGCINTYVIYLADDEKGSIRSLSTSLDFSQNFDIENCKGGMNLDENLTIQSFETKILNGRKIHIKAILDSNIKIYSNSDFEIIKQIQQDDNMQVLNNSQNIISLIGEGNSKTFAKDTIAIDQEDDIAEIMKVDFNIVDEEVKISYNKVLIKADANVEIMYLTEQNKINTALAKIPIMGFVDIPDITENSICNVKTKLKNLIIKPNNSGEHTVYVDAEIEMWCSAYERKDINLIEDLYSLSENVIFSQNKVNAMIEKIGIKENYDMSEQITRPELINSQILNATVKPKILSTKIRKGKAIYEGSINIEFIYDYNGEISTEVIELPFNFEISSDKIMEDSNIETSVTVKKEDLDIIPGEKINLNINLVFNALVEKNKRLNVIDNITVEEDNQEDLYSMVIYFVKPGDTLWKIAKEFRSKVDDIARINNIEDANKIYPGNKLYIPKFSRRSISA